MTFTVVVTKDEEEDVYNASVPALPGRHTWGDTVDEAFANAEEAIRSYVGSLVKSNEPIPQE